MITLAQRIEALRTERGLSRPALSPVSYTHLDVYKRQVKAWEEENGEIQSGEAVLFHTGHDALWETDPDEYITNYPYLCLLYTSRCV